MKLIILTLTLYFTAFCSGKETRMTVYSVNSDKEALLKKQDLSKYIEDMGEVKKEIRYKYVFGKLFLPNSSMFHNYDYRLWDFRMTEQESKNPAVAWETKKIHSYAQSKLLEETPSISILMNPVTETECTVYVSFLNVCKMTVTARAARYKFKDRI